MLGERAWLANALRHACPLCPLGAQHCLHSSQVTKAWCLLFLGVFWKTHHILFDFFGLAGLNTPNTQICIGLEEQRDERDGKTATSSIAAEAGAYSGSAWRAVAAGDCYYRTRSVCASLRGIQSLGLPPDHRQWRIETHRVYSELTLLGYLHICDMLVPDHLKAVPPEA